MKTSIPVLIAAIVVSGALGFFIGRSNAPAKISTNATNTSKAVAVNNTNNSKTPTVTKPATESTTPAPTPPPTPPPAPPKPEEPKPSTSKDDLSPIKTGISDRKISSVLESISSNLEAKRLSYNSSMGQDCSGIYHQMKDSIQARIPALATSSEYQYPAYKTVRSSRQIADWYHTQGNLLIVEDPIKSKNSIRPGSVMFYGKPNKRYSNMTIQSLTDKDNNYTRNGQIMHIAVVTSIRTDKDGNLVDYTIMHGRNSRNHASRTGSKEVQSKNTKGLPAFGNWSQQWVAVANIATKK